MEVNNTKSLKMLDTFPLIFETFHIIITECTVGPLQKSNLLIESNLTTFFYLPEKEKSCHFRFKINIFVWNLSSYVMSQRSFCPCSSLSTMHEMLNRTLSFNVTSKFTIAQKYIKIFYFVTKIWHFDKYFREIYFMIEIEAKLPKFTSLSL